MQTMDEISSKDRADKEIHLEASHYSAFFMYLGRGLKINIALSPMVTGLPFLSTFFLSPNFVYFAEKVNPRWLQLNLFFLLFLGIPLST